MKKERDDLLPVVTSVDAFRIPMPFDLDRIFVTASGIAPTSGWTNVRLSPYYYITPPDDGFWEFDLRADPPADMVLEVQLPVSASGFFAAPDWLKGIRIYAASNSVETSALSQKTLNSITNKNRVFLFPDHVIVRQQIASYDDSFQPIGLCGGFSVKMKKLSHSLTLIVEGPDENRIRQCIAESTGIGLIAAIIAVYATGGGALSAATGAFLGHLKGCLGDSFSARLEDESHWVEWCT